ncbi:hypothetical protein F5880DRAFT_976115 [Lentinula raphanica]|nr:hypothetical protein F5880DRAFT_976115 [Lentinula raphanica]
MQAEFSFLHSMCTLYNISRRLTRYVSLNVAQERVGRVGGVRNLGQVVVGVSTDGSFPTTTPLMPKISKANKTYAQEMAAKWHKYERFMAKRTALIRTYPNYQDVMNTTYQEAATLPVNFMPKDQAERDEFAGQMEECIRTLESSDELLDHFRVASAAFFLCRKIQHDTIDRGEQVHLETLRAKTALHRAHPYALEKHPLPGITTRSSRLTSSVSSLSPAVTSNTITSNPSRPTGRKDTPVKLSNPSLTPMPPLAPQLPHRENEHVRAPLAMPVEDPFTWDKVNQESATPVSSQQIQQWRQSPATFPLNQMFIGDVDGNEEAFKVVAFMDVGSEKVFYVQLVDEDEAIAYSDKQRFSSSWRV